MWYWWHFIDGEVRSYLDPTCLKEPAVKEVGRGSFHPNDCGSRISPDHFIILTTLCEKVFDSLLSWLNQFLSESRVRLTSLEDDLKVLKYSPFFVPTLQIQGPHLLSLIYNIFIISKDGMVMKLVLEKLTGQEVVTPQPDSVWQYRYRQSSSGLCTWRSSFKPAR